MLCGYVGIKQLLVALIGDAVASVVGEDHSGPGPHRRRAARAAAALDEGGGIVGGFVLQHEPDSAVVESDLEGGSGDDQVGFGVDAGVLGGGAADPQGALIE